MTSLLTHKAHIHWPLSYMATHFAHRFRSYMAFADCSEGNLILKWQIDMEGFGLVDLVIVLRGLLAEGLLYTIITMLSCQLN